MYLVTSEDSPMSIDKHTPLRRESFTTKPNTTNKLFMTNTANKLLEINEGSAA